MIDIILSGCNGKMGHVISELVDQRDDCRITAGIDKNVTEDGAFPQFSNIFDFGGNANVIIDFSHPSALSDLLSFATLKNIPVVLATTGYTDKDVRKIKSAAENIPLFFTANMSIGINLLSALAKKAASVLSGDFDIEIIEKHHNQKLDAPSGTAIMLANEISTVLEKQPIYEYDRHSKRCKRSKNEIGLHAVRGGNIVGEHEIIFAGHDEIISLSHSARSKEIFAAGAINAALYMVAKENGIYNMSDLISGGK